MFASADEIVSVDGAGSMITIKQNSVLRTFRLKPFTDIVLNGQKASVAQLKAGMQATVELLDPETAAKVVARGNAPPPTAGTPSPFLSSIENRNLTHRITVKATVDAGDNVIVQDGKLHIQHIDWSLPKDISINGIRWKPEWKDKTSEDFTGFNPPLAPFADSKINVQTVTKKKTAEVKVLELPTEANGQKLVVHLQDNDSGASVIEIRITWGGDANP